MRGPAFWLAVCTDLRNRGSDPTCYIACADGLTGLPEAIEAIFPHTLVQLCLVHLVRNSLKYVNYKQRAEVARDLKTIYSAATAEEAEFQLEVFAEKWDAYYPARSCAWRAHWTRVIPLFSAPCGDPARGVYDQCHRIVECLVAQRDLDPSDFPLG